MSNGKSFFVGVIFGFGILAASFSDDAARIQITLNDPNGQSTQALKSDLEQLDAKSNPTADQYTNVIDNAVNVVTEEQATSQKLESDVQNRTAQLAAAEANLQADNATMNQQQQQLHQNDDYISGTAGGKVAAGTNAEAGDSGLSNLGMAFVTIAPVLVLGLIAAAIWNWRLKTKHELQSPEAVDEQISSFRNATKTLSELDTPFDNPEDHVKILAVHSYLSENQGIPDPKVICVMLQEVSGVLQRNDHVSPALKNQVGKIDFGYSQKELSIYKSLVRRYLQPHENNARALLAERVTQTGQLNITSERYSSSPNSASTKTSSSADEGRSLLKRKTLPRAVETPLPEAIDAWQKGIGGPQGLDPIPEPINDMSEESVPQPPRKAPSNETKSQSGDLGMVKLQLLRLGKSAMRTTGVSPRER